MLDIIFRLILISALLISIIYGIIILVKNKNCQPIFKVALIGMVAFLIARLFFLVLTLAHGDEDNFSVGVLGQVAGYLFLASANKAYVPFDTGKVKFNFKALLIEIVPLICFAYTIYVQRTLDNVVCSILYSLSTCFALYYAFNNLLLCKKDKRYNCLKGFNICIVILTLFACVENTLPLIDSDLIYIIILLVSINCSVVSITFNLPLLNKGVNQNDC